MLESEIKKLTAAVEANTAAILGGGVAPGAITPAVEVKPEPAAPAAETKPDPLAIDLTPAPETDADVVEPVAAAVTLADITPAIVALCKSKGREAAAQLMAEYGAQKVPDLKKDPAKYGEILAKINALIAAK